MTLPATCTENHAVFSFTKGNETLEKTRTPILSPFFFLMHLAECLPLSGPTFFKVASLLGASTSSLLNRCNLVKSFSHCQNQRVHLTWPLEAFGTDNHSFPMKPLVSLLALVFLLPLWLPPLSFSNRLLFYLLLKHYGSWVSVPRPSLYSIYSI